MSNQAPVVFLPLAFGGPEYLAEMGVAAMALKSRRDLVRVIDGARRMLADRTPGGATLTLVEKGKLLMRLLAVIDVSAWKDLAPGRFNQIYQNEMAERLKLIANSIQNNGATAGPGWKLEPSPAADNEAA